MPDTFANPYTDSPIGAALRNLSSVITRGPNDAQNILRAEAALKLKQARENKEGVGGMLRQFGTPGFDQNAAVDMAVRGDVSPATLGGFQRLQSATRYGAADPRTDAAAVGAGASYGSTAGAFHENQANETQRTQMGITGANQRNQATINEQRYQFDNKPISVGTDQGPVIQRQSEAYGQPAVESLGNVKGNAARVALNSPGGLASADPTTRRFIDAAGPAGSPHNYTFEGKNYITTDGVNNAGTGQPLPHYPDGSMGAIASLQGGEEAVGLSGNKTIDKQILDSRVAAGTAAAMIDRLKTSLSQPNAAQATGYLGSVARTFNDIRSQVEATTHMFGGESAAQSFASPETQSVVDGAVNRIFGDATFNQRAQQLGINASIMRSQIQDLAYTIAKAQDPGGRVSVDDIRRAAETVGASIMDPQAAIPVLDDLKARIGHQQTIRETITRQMYPQLRGGSPAAAPAAPGAANPPTAAPGAPTSASDPLASARDAISRGADRNAVIQRLQQNGINPAGL